MNFYAHLVVARETGESAPVGFGAMLPDLARMARVRLPDSLPDDIARGVWFHHRTDEAFHGHPAFTRGTTMLRRALDERASDGLGPGARRAIAHVGWELMLDGVLVARSHSAWWADSWQHAAVVPLRLRSELSQPRWPERYASVDWIAERLVYILGARPRLAFSPECTGDVAAALGVVRDQVVAVVSPVVADVLAAVRAGTDHR